MTRAGYKLCLRQKLIKKFSNIVCKTCDELKEKLSPELFKLYEKFASALEGNFSDDVDFYYVKGFKLGLQIIIECMED